MTVTEKQAMVSLLTEANRNLAAYKLHMESIQRGIRLPLVVAEWAAIALEKAKRDLMLSRWIRLNSEVN